MKGVFPICRLCLYIISSYLCPDAEASPRGSKSAASASPRRFHASPRSCFGLNVMASKFRYDIIIHNFHLASASLMMPRLRFRSHENCLNHLTDVG